MKEIFLKKSENKEKIRHIMLSLNNNEKQRKFLCLVDQIHLLENLFGNVNLRVIRGNFSSLDERQFFDSLNAFFYKAEEIEKDLRDPTLTKQLKKYLRSTIYEYLDQSIFLRRGLLKPRGYPGDFKVVEAMYENRTVSKGLGAVLDRYFLTNDYVQAVRDRKDFMKQFLFNYFEVNKMPRNIMNIACGSCREIRELLKSASIDLSRRSSLVLLDQDEMAINFAKRKIGNKKHSLRMRYVVSDFIKFFKNKELKDFDLIYSIGLADYLPDSILGLLIKYSFHALSPHGQLLVAHKNTKKWTSPVSDWGADWKFIPRNKADVKNIIEKYLSDEGEYKMRFLKSNSDFLFYFHILKD